MTKVKLTSSEITSFASDIYKVLIDVPLYYLHEVLEMAEEQRQKDGEDPDLDLSDSDENISEKSSEEDESSSEESDGA